MPRVSRRDPWPFRLPRPLNTGTFLELECNNRCTDTKQGPGRKQILTTYGEESENERSRQKNLVLALVNEVDCPLIVL
jgi:hypothetical protein